MDIYPFHVPQRPEMLLYLSLLTFSPHLEAELILSIRAQQLSFTEILAGVLPQREKRETMWSHTFSTSYLCILGCVCIMWMCACRRAGAVPR